MPTLRPSLLTVAVLAPVAEKIGSVMVISLTSSEALTTAIPSGDPSDESYRSVIPADGVNVTGVTDDESGLLP